MITDLLALTDTEEFEDNGIIRLARATWPENLLEFHIEVGLLDGTMLERWQITCAEPRAYRVSNNVASGITLTQNHVLLWPYQHPHTQVSFHGRSDNPLPVIGALYRRHLEIVDAWIPFHQFFNPLVSLPILLAGPGGMLADGPEPLVLAYEEVLNQHGYHASHLAFRPAQYWDGKRWVDEYADLSVLLLDASFVVAKDFQAHRMSDTCVKDGIPHLPLMDQPVNDSATSSEPVKKKRGDNSELDTRLALARRESDETKRLALYEQLLEDCVRLHDVVGEATCASLAAAIYRRRRQFDEARHLYLRSFRLWTKAQNRKEVGNSLIHLADLLEVEGKYVDACRLVYRAKKLLAHSLDGIGARDILNNISYTYHIAPEQYESDKTAEELVSEIFPRQE